MENSNQKPPEKAVEITALRKTITDAEYLEFCRHCARHRLSIPSREDVAKIKAKFAGDFQGRPAWLQLRPFPRQETPKLWLMLDREQVFMELERQVFTPPKLSDKEQQIQDSRARILKRIMEG